MQESWGADDPSTDLDNKTSAYNLKLLDDKAKKQLMFEAIRASNLTAIRNLLQSNRNLVNSKMYGFEGSDVYEIISDNKSKRCYNYTGNERDGFFYPLHVATEAGLKNLTVLLIKAGADVLMKDYKGDIAEDKCNGEAKHAFYELQGLKFEAVERYEGILDRNKLKTGKGSLYYKAEGYHNKEHLLYRGHFKEGVYQGYGLLNWEGVDKHRYVGRFKSGQMHGKGIEFNKNGDKIYQGTFREDQREGLGEEYIDGVRSYRGEFSEGHRHGFGIAYFAEGHRFVGRFEKDIMAGIGIYGHPNGDRYEGIFYNNRPDGPGSYYKKVKIDDSDEYTVTCQHAIWQTGRPLKDLDSPFEPHASDLPNKREEITIETTTTDDDLTEGEQIQINQLKDPINETVHDEDWKSLLGHYIRIPAKDAKILDIKLKSTKKENVIDNDNKENNEYEEEDEEEDDEPDLDDEVLAYHFTHCATLFAAYIYVSSAAKVFEGRLQMDEMHDVAPDFEAVYHIVTDAVDSYNENWQKALKQQQEIQEVEKQEQAELELAIKNAKTPNALKKVLAEASKGKNLQNENIIEEEKTKTVVEMKRRLFMTEKEKKEEQTLKQRAELAMKKGATHLDSEIEYIIGTEILNTLQSELKLLLPSVVLDNNNNNNNNNVSKVTKSEGKAEGIETNKKLRRGSVMSKNNEKEQENNKSNIYVQSTPIMINEFAKELLDIISTSESIQTRPQYASNIHII